MSSESLPRLKAVVDTNVVVDFMNARQPFYKDARLLMALGAVGEMQLWMPSSQITDLVYILSEGGKHAHIPEVLERLRKLRSFIKVADVGSSEIDGMLETDWTDPEDALLHEVALSLQADCIISRDAKGFQKAILPVLDCKQFFEWIEEKYGITYAELLELS